MTSTIKTLVLASCVVTAFAGRSARAQDYDGSYSNERWDDYSWSDPSMQTGVGVGVMVGGGVTGFTNREARNVTSDIGGLWDARVSLGTHVPIGIEASYVGTAQEIRGVFGGPEATMIGTTAEGDLRWNILPHMMFTPYLFAGVGWQRFSIDDRRFVFSSTSLNRRDDLLEVPLGGGLSYRFAGFVAEARGTFRATTNEDLIINPITGSAAKMHNWEGSLQVGAEF
ncbi:MAG: hypothetical protein JWO36_1064 [Myxococcales bacterium]|nr:hypothetical protein [Myxococcales bacterium]